MQIRETWILGDCCKVVKVLAHNNSTKPKPYVRAKHDAWASLENMERDLAMEKYIENLKQIIETMNFSADVEKFMEVVRKRCLYTANICSLGIGSLL